MSGLRHAISTLAAAAACLKEASGVDAPFALAFLTDRSRIAYPEIVARALPRGAAVILRDYDDPGRRALARRLRAITAARGVLLLVGGDDALSLEIGADGVHRRSGEIGAPAPRPELLSSAACHDAADLDRAAAAGAAICLLSPVFATESHPGAEHLGPNRFRALASRSRLPVLALGGVTAQNAPSLEGPNVAGIAGIGCFAAL